jgi:hypothetical protein
MQAEARRTEAGGVVGLQITRPTTSGATTPWSSWPSAPPSTASATGARSPAPRLVLTLDD